MFYAIVALWLVAVLLHVYSAFEHSRRPRVTEPEPKAVETPPPPPQPEPVPSRPTYDDDPHEMVKVLIQCVARATRIAEESGPPFPRELVERQRRQAADHYERHIDKERFPTFEFYQQYLADLRAARGRGVRQGVAEAVSIVRAWDRRFADIKEMRAWKSERRKSS